MAYDALAASVELIERGLPGTAPHLSRRTRFAPVAVDVDDEVAVTVFVRRGVSGEAWLDEHALEHRGGAWHLLGGGSGNVGDEVLTPRPSAEELGADVVERGAGMTIRNADRIMPWGAQYVRWQLMRVAAGIGFLRVGHRRVQVPDHGLAVVVWSSRHKPGITVDRS